MRVISYNIQHGGAEREQLLHQVIAEQQPDIVGLVEAEDTAVIERLAIALGMDFIRAEGNSRASALLSRFPIGDTINHALRNPALSRSCLEAWITDDAGNQWAVTVSQLHAGAAEADEIERERETSALLDIFAPLRDAKTPHLLCGDFNASAPCQRIHPDHCKPETREAWKANGGQLPRRVITKILAAGYRDSLQVFDPAAAEVAGTFSTDHPGQRVDYLFVFGVEPRRIRSAWIDHRGIAPSASDHFPVGLEIL